MLHNFTFGWSSNELTDEQIEKIQPLIQGQIEKDKHYKSYVGDVAEILRACPTLKLEVSGGEVPGSVFITMLTSIERIEAKLLLIQQPRMNNHVSVAIPGLGLLLIREVTVLEDACTDNLQRALNQGWSILAVCPQEQRRPDYILGRSSPSES